MNQIRKTVCLYGLITVLSASTMGCSFVNTSSDVKSSAAETSSFAEESMTESLPEETEVETETQEEYEEPVDITLEEKEAILAEYEWLGIVHNTANGILNVRMEPSTKAFIMGKAFENAAVHIVEDVGEWYKIEEHGAIGYVSKDFIITGEEARQIAMDNMKRRAVVTTAALNIRKGPSTHTNIMGRVYSQGSYAVKEEYDTWMKIQVTGEQEGFVHSDYVDIVIGLDAPIISDEYSNLSQLRRNLVNMAWSHMGGKYVWGGTKLGEGVDCSGFMLRLYEKQGIRLNRVAKAQALQGRYVSAEEMKPGDLVFYYVNKDYISHVAMYVGNGKIVHAASAEKGIRMDEYDYIKVAFMKNLIGD